MNLEAINSDPDLRGTPIGNLSVRRMPGGWHGVFVDDGISPPRCIHTLDERGVWAALWGKAFWASAAVQEVYANLHDVADKSHEREEAARNGDVQRDFRKWLQRDDARDVLLGGKR